MVGMEQFHSIFGGITLWHIVCVLLALLFAMGLYKQLLKPCRDAWVKKQEREDHLYETVAANNSDIKLLKEQREQDVRNSIKHDEKIEAKVDRIADLLLDERIDNKRSAILNFANAAQNGKTQDKEQFDWILAQYDKYEKILQEYSLENGQVEQSMKYIRELYAEKMKSGF